MNLQARAIAARTAWIGIATVSYVGGAMLLVTALGNEACSAFHGLAREHSRKPEEAYREAERLMPDARRIELFSRTNRPGWTVWGDEVGKFEAAA